MCSLWYFINPYINIDRRYLFLSSFSLHYTAPNGMHFFLICMCSVSFCNSSQPTTAIIFSIYLIFSYTSHTVIWNFIWDTFVSVALQIGTHAGYKYYSTKCFDMNYIAAIVLTKISLTPFIVGLLLLLWPLLLDCCRWCCCCCFFFYSTACRFFFSLAPMRSGAISIQCISVYACMLLHLFTYCRHWLCIFHCSCNG